MAADLAVLWRDEPNYSTRAEGQKLLTELGGPAPGEVYFRAHNLMTTRRRDSRLKWGSTNLYTEKDGKPVYDFTLVDRIIDTYRGARHPPLSRDRLHA